MDCDGRTIILSTPEELLPLITEAIRLANLENAQATSKGQTQKLLSPKDVEKEFGIRQKTLAYWRLEGIGPTYTSFGRRIFYERAILEQYIASGRIQTSENIR